MGNTKNARLWFGATFHAFNLDVVQLLTGRKSPTTESFVQTRVKGCFQQRKHIKKKVINFKKRIFAEF